MAEETVKTAEEKENEFKFELDERFISVASVPQSALKTIDFGKLKGKFDINPQWRIEAMTRAYGLCGVNWKVEMESCETKEYEDHQISIFMVCNLYIKDKNTGEWSAAIKGFGGDFIRKKTKNGFEINDDAYKCCWTDAIGNAMKYLGVAHSVYSNGKVFYDSKYNKEAGFPENVQKVVDTFGGKAEKVEPAQKTESKLDPVEFRDGQYMVYLKQGWKYVKDITSDELLEKLLTHPSYRKAHDAIAQELANRKSQG